MSSEYSLDHYSFMQNRELSWLKFNERILEEAKEQLKLIYETVRFLYTKKDHIFNQLMYQLKNEGFISAEWEGLVETDKKHLKEYFKSEIKPILSPQIVDAHRPFPHFNHKELYIFTLLKHKEGSQIGILQVPKCLPEYIQLPGRMGQFILIEKNVLSITRNADVAVDDESFDVTEDYRSTMKKMMKKRNKIAVVRLEGNYHMSEALRRELSHHFKVKSDHMYVTKMPMNSFKICVWAI